MLVTRKSMLSGQETTLDLDVTEEQLARYAEGTALVQHVFPHLSRDHREFIMTGVTPEEWNKAFPPEDEDDDEDEDDEDEEDDDE